MSTEKIDPKNLPLSFGVFKPVGHVVMAFEHEDDRQAARATLKDGGFADDALRSFGAEEMKGLIDEQLEKASGMSSLGQEWNLIKHNRALAADGYCWLIVHATGDAQVQQVRAAAARHHAELAHRYGRLAIEELV